MNLVMTDHCHLEIKFIINIGLYMQMEDLSIGAPSQTQIFEIHIIFGYYCTVPAIKFIVMTLFWVPFLFIPV
jgi:hypothetical protein